MKPLEPEISVRMLTEDDVDSLRELLNSVLNAMPYSAPLDAQQALDQVLGQDPHAVFPIRWQRNRCLGAWRGGRLIGFADIAVGQDSDSRHLPDYQPLGLMRFLALPERADLLEETAGKLLTMADDVWRRAGVVDIKAFHISTGYPSFQAGAGLLPGEMETQFRFLTAHGYQLADRYYALRRVLGDMMEEEVPMADVSLVYRGDATDRRYEIYHRRAERIATARTVRAALDGAKPPLKIAYVTDIQVEPPRRNRNVARWLLRRMINDATLEGYQEMLAHLRVDQHLAMGLFTRMGFEELDYRGYTLEKTLAN
jgi:ribosomal protein S18 acetylase RimI-like enzyme